MSPLPRALLAGRAFTSLSTRATVSASPKHASKILTAGRRAFSAAPKRLATEQPKARYFMGLKKFPAMTWEPMYPFLIAALIMSYAISNFADALMQTDEYKDDPRNPHRSKPSDSKV